MIKKTVQMLDKKNFLTPAERIRNFELNGCGDFLCFFNLNESKSQLFIFADKRGFYFLVFNKRDSNIFGRGLCHWQKITPAEDIKICREYNIRSKDKTLIIDQDTGDIAFKPGRIGTVSRSGSLTYYVADTLTRSEYGETTCVGLGGDPVLGSTFNEILQEFDGDEATRAVVMVGEIGGVYEERSVPAVKAMTKPVIFMVGGVFAPQGKRMGHAGAIIEGNLGTAQSKIKALESAGAYHAKTFMEIPEILRELGI